MNNPEIPPWSKLIDGFLAGDAIPFFQQLKFIVVRHRFFRGCTAFEIKSQYDIEPEDYLQERFLELLRLDYPRRWKNENLSDDQLNLKIRGFIRNRLIDRARVKRYAVEETEVMSLHAVEKDESEILAAVKARLSRRQLFIFENYRKFEQGGDDDVQTLAEKLKVSKKTIEPEIRKIKEIVAEEFIKESPRLGKYSRIKQNNYEPIQQIRGTLRARV